MLEPWWLPGLPGASGPSGPPESVAAWHAGETAAGTPFRTPRLSADQAAAVAADVRDAARHSRAALGLDAVVAALARSARALGDPGDPAGQDAGLLLAEELGWPETFARETLERMAEIWTEDALWAVLRAELPDPGVLDRFRADASDPDDTPGRCRRAAAPLLSLHVHSGSVPGVAVTSVVRGLLARGGVLCKTARDEPALLCLFARTLAREEPLLARCLAVTWWPGAAMPPAWRTWVARCGRVVVYGGTSAVEAVRGRVPGEVEIVAYGPRASAGVVLPDAARGADARRAATRLARDVCAYEQRGCLSPRSVFVIGDPDPFADALAAALRDEVGRAPPPSLRAAEAIALRELRAEVEFSAYREPGGRPTRLLAGKDLAWTVVVEPFDTLEAETLARVVRIHPVRELERVEAILRPWEGRLQALGYGGTQGLRALAEAAFGLGVPRVAPFGRVAWPPADWRHEGRHQILPLLRWTDWELPE